jgi:SWI/SNF-related matrix-associated actin-dependent regulator 1 of chromatin subfamily A
MNGGCFVMYVVLSAGLLGHQAAALRALIESVANQLLAWEMGTGKTCMAARLGWALGPHARNLIIVPASLLEQTRRELIRWGQPGVTVQILRTGKGKLSTDCSWVVVSYDLARTTLIYRQLIAENWDLLVLDESHLLRGWTTKRTRAVYGRGGIASHARRTLCLSGTPVVASAADLFPMLYTLCPAALAVSDGKGGRRTMSGAEFEARFCVMRTVHLPGGRTKQVPSGSKNTAELRTRIESFVSRMRRADVLDLLPLVINTFALTVAPTAELTAALAALPPELLTQLESASDDQLLGLLQRHAPMLATLRRLLGLSKVPAAIDYALTRFEGGADRLILFHHHRDVADALLSGLRQAGISAANIRGDTAVAMRTRLVDRFNAGELSTLVLQLQSGGLGWNLQSCAFAAFVESDWTAATNQQAISRIYRAGQRRPVTVDFLSVPDSLDERITAVAARKAEVAAAIIERQPEGE